MTLISFGFFLLVFVVIGLLSVLRREQTGADYLLASHSVKPWLVGLSAVATNNSGYMFIGMIGFTYTYGLSSIWLMIGWITGDFLASLFVHEKLRVTTEAQDQHSFAGALASWNGTDYKLLRLLGGILTVLFLGAYAAAQLNAGSKALHVLFGWEYGVGALVGAVIVLLYCFAGGIRASIWTDAAQSMVMLVAMALMMWTGLGKLGGWSSFQTALAGVSPHYMDWFPGNLSAGGFGGPVLFILGWLFAGAAVIGQPHIMVRFMAMDDPKNMWRVRAYYYGWFIGVLRDHDLRRPGCAAAAAGIRQLRRRARATDACRQSAAARAHRLGAGGLVRGDDLHRRLGDLELHRCNHPRLPLSRIPHLRRNEGRDTLRHRLCARHRARTQRERLQPGVDRVVGPGQRLRAADDRLLAQAEAA